MSIDTIAAVRFLAGHGRILDRRRVDLLLGRGYATSVLRLAARQQPDGGWTVDFESSSPAASLEWRGYATVAAVATLRP